MPSDVTRTPEEIWAGDLFNRREEAQQLTAYIESVVARPILREDKKAYTIAVDARYGEGKTFFLKRLAEDLASRHPVAFVDAWADDLADEPLTALAATLNEALKPFMGKPEVKRRIADFMVKSGKVAKIAGVGLLKKAAALAITAQGVEAIEDVLTGESADVKKAVNEGIRDASKGAVDDISSGLAQAGAQGFMEQRVEAFEAGRKAVQEMKQSLQAIVDSLSEETLRPPIIILIDELDRCRPNYAIKLLEEIKHLFDVPGLVFILAMNGEQLGHAVSGAYGTGFDGRAYLRRFIDREYRLAEPELTPLLQQLCEQADLMGAQFAWPKVALQGEPARQVALPELLSIYMRLFDLRARDAYSLVDVLQTSAALAGGNVLHLPYLVPLAVGQLLGLPRGAWPPMANVGWVFVIPTSYGGHQSAEILFETIAQEFARAARLTDRQLNAEPEGGGPYSPVAVVRHTRSWNVQRQPLWAAESYPSLLSSVGRFKNPALDDDA